jgi:hypothetical protein
MAKKNYYSKIDQIRVNYYRDLKNVGKNNQAKCAIVLFRSMEGYSRARKVFKVSCFKRFLYTVFFCYKSASLTKIRFHEKFMRIRQAVEPDLILWQNFGISKKSRFIRTIFFVIFTFILLVFCFYGIVSLENFIQ